MTQLVIGASVPKFHLLDQDSEPVEPAQFLGKWLVIYFYPKAATPGCTVQACGIRDSVESWTALGAQVIGISPDLPAKLKKFSLAQNLDFPLLSDASHEVAETYGVWALKKFMGKSFMGIVRTTFIVNPAGKLASIMDDFKTATHHEALLARLKLLQY